MMQGGPGMMGGPPGPTGPGGVPMHLDSTGAPISGPSQPKPKLFLLVTKIAPEVEEGHIQKLLECCGEVHVWRRARGANGEPLSFGFAQFGDPDAIWKAEKCLAGKMLNGQPLKVLVEEQTESMVQAWRQKQKGTFNVTNDPELEFELEKIAVSCR